ncbi:valyl-tRNA synthetase [Ramicandelaber brevisporus]|nr:valyl-tRNA synthetase [Ramicandelaber brevisporus]
MLARLRLARRSFKQPHQSSACGHPVYPVYRSTRGIATGLPQIGAKYDPKQLERDVSRFWEHSAVTSARTQGTVTNEEKPLFRMLAPPPNVTGVLHIGHALTAAIQDSLARYKRMSGHKVEWVPGLDHAGISTQSVIEKWLMAQNPPVSRHDLGRDRFVEHAHNWCEVYGSTINKQHRRLGASMNWDMEYFTLDTTRSKSVTDAFVKLFDDGLIYRAERMVSWCTHLQTVLSDIEVDRYELTKGPEHIQLPGRSEKLLVGMMYTVAYPIITAGGHPLPDGAPTELLVQTTRPETIPGDVALAVHPNDPRYSMLLNTDGDPSKPSTFVAHPLTGRPIPVVGDSTLVDPAYGTGVVKVTPAHDVDDALCGSRHNLPAPQIINTAGHLVNDSKYPNVTLPSELVGMDRFDARFRVLRLLTERGYFRGKVASPAGSSVARCARSGDLIEPLPLPQWYLKCTGDLAAMAVDQVKSGRVKLIPKEMESEWERWLGKDSIRDWCISRQLWWGHRIPAYKVTVNRNEGGASTRWIAAVSDEQLNERIQSLCTELNLPSDSVSSGLLTVEPDSDVLDTWFSSGLLPITAFDDNRAQIMDTNASTTASLQSGASPLTNLLETGSDILFFWVARMMMLSAHFTNGTRVPFETVLLHPLIRDSQGRKMSKSLGNVLDPLHVIDGITLAEKKNALRSGSAQLSASEIARCEAELCTLYPNGIKPYGADALRFALIRYTEQTVKINMDISAVESASHFANKVFNLVRFYERRLAEHVQKHAGTGNNGLQFLEERYVLSRAAATFEDYISGFNSYKLAKSAAAVRQFTVGDVCDVYVEVCKADTDNKHLSALRLQTLALCIDLSMRMLHPFMPFATEALWQHLNSLQSNARPPILLDNAQLPSPGQVQKHRNASSESLFGDVVLGSLKTMRSLRQIHGVPLGQPAAFTIHLTNGDYSAVLDPNSRIGRWLGKMASASSIDLRIGQSEDSKTLHAVCNGVSISIQVNTSPEEAAAAQQRRELSIAKLEVEIGKITTRISNPGYQSKATEATKKRDSDRLQQLRDQLTQLGISS